MKKLLILPFIILYLPGWGCPLDSLKSTLGVGVSVNRYLLSAFENYAFSTGKFVTEHHEIGVDFRYFQSANEPGRIINRTPFQSKFYQFQPNIYLKSHRRFANINVYRYTELGLHFTNSINRNGDEFITNEQESYILPNFSLGLGSDYFFGRKGRFGIDGNFFVSNGKFRWTETGFRGFLVGNLFPVVNVSVTGKIKF